MAEDLLDRILAEIRARMAEARGAYEESQQLERALAALEGEARGQTLNERSKPVSRRRRRSAGARRGANREAIIAAVTERPGSTTREIADATNIARTTVASTVTRLAASGALERSELPGGGIGLRVGADGSAS